MAASLTRKLYTLTIIKQESMVLLGFKKRGFGKGKINGFGGKVEKGETIHDAAIRWELKLFFDLQVFKHVSIVFNVIIY